MPTTAGDGSPEGHDSVIHLAGLIGAVLAALGLALGAMSLVLLFFD